MIVAEESDITIDGTQIIVVLYMMMYSRPASRIFLTGGEEFIILHKDVQARADYRDSWINLSPGEK